jgi:hypothetical protein
MMKNKLKISISLLLISFLISYSSPFKDIEVGDFKLIRSSFNVVKDISNDRTISNMIEVYITDKKYKRFKLDDAVITVNGNEMGYNNGFFKKNIIRTLNISKCGIRICNYFSKWPNCDININHT